MEETTRSGATVAAAGLRKALVVLALLVMAVGVPGGTATAAAQDGEGQGEIQEGTDQATAAEEAPPPAPPRCDSEDHAAFDFWVGEWDVYRWRDEWDLAAWRKENPDAQPAVNRIEKIHDGCALREEYSAPRGYEGSSVNFYDRADGRWHQTWIDSTGTALYLVGGMEGDTMVLADDPPEGRPHSRISWQPQEDGSVRQTWEQSPDGESWKVVFDGRYVRRGGSE